MKINIIGVCGGSGSGKTTLTQGIKSYLGNEASILSLDNYYKPLKEQEVDKNGIVNFDLLTALDTEKFVKDLHELKNGNAIRLQNYTFNDTSKTEKDIIVLPKKYLLVEGIFLLELLKNKSILDITVFVETEMKQMLDRRLQRDTSERNISREMVLYQWENHFVPAFKKFIAPHSAIATLLINGGLDFDIPLIIGKIKSALESKALL